MGQSASRALLDRIMKQSDDKSSMLGIYLVYLGIKPAVFFNLDGLHELRAVELDYIRDLGLRATELPEGGVFVTRDPLPRKAVWTDAEIGKQLGFQCTADFGKEPNRAIGVWETTTDAWVVVESCDMARAGLMVQHYTEFADKANRALKPDYQFEVRMGVV
jgi:hypothetical protein